MTKNKLNEIPKWPKTKLEKDLERLPGRFITWLFFYKYKDKVDAFIHILTILAWLFLGWAISRG